LQLLGTISAVIGPIARGTVLQFVTSDSPAVSGQADLTIGDIVLYNTI
jgi:hypothetical protein